MAVANRSDLRIVREAVWGTTPAVTASNKADTLRINSHSLQWEQEYVDSQAIRSDRGRDRGSAVSGQVTGDMVLEFLPGAQDQVMSYLIGQAATLAAGTDLDSVAAKAGAFTKSGHGKVAGDWVRAHGFAAGINGFYRVKSTTGNDLTVVGTGTPATDSASAGKMLSGTSYLGAGLTPRSFSAEVGLNDAGDYFVRSGCRVGSMGLEVSPGGIIAATYGVLGKGKSHTAVRTMSDAHTNASASGRPSNAADDVIILIDDDEIKNVTSISLNIENNLRPTQFVGTFGAGQIGLGSASISGSIEFVTDDYGYYDDMLQRNALSLSLVIGQDAGWYAIDVPLVDFTGARTVVEGLDTDIVLATDFSASIKDGNMYRITRGA